MDYSADVFCDVCQETLATASGKTPEVMWMSAFITGLLCHAAAPHCNHGMRLERAPVDKTDDIAVLRCLNPQCERLDLKMEEPCTEWGQLATYSVIFHTSHEGHPLDIRWRDFHAISPPTRQEYEKGQVFPHAPKR